MKKATLLGALASASILATSFTATATEWHKGTPGLRYSGLPESAARAFLHNHAQALRVEGIDLQQKRVLALRALRTVRYQQQHEGLPVFGKWVAVRVDPHGGVRAAAVDVARGLTVSTTPKIDEAHALSVVSTRVGKSLSPQHARFELGVLPYESRGGILVWHVDVILEHHMHRFVVDAHTGGVILDYSLAHDAMGRVYEVNPFATPNLVDTELMNLDTADPMSLTGFDGKLKVFGYASGDVNYGDLEGTQTAPSSGEDFLFDPNPEASSLDDPFGEVMGYYHAARIRSFFEDTFDLDMTGAEYHLAVVTSYSASPEYIMNAFYTPWLPGYPAFPDYARNLICLGRGFGEDLAYDSDVLLHEFTHYISQNAMNYADMGYYDQYGLSVMSGAINEGTADYYSSSLNEDPVVGEFALGSYARDLSASPPKCPDDVYGESHEDGKLIGTATWAIHEALGAETANQLVWGALSFIGSGAALGDFAEGIVQTAQDLNLDTAQMSQINDILSERGLDDCKRSLELNGKPRNTFLIGLDMVGQMMGASCNQAKNYGIYMSSIFQFVYTPDPEDTAVKIDFDLDNLQGSGSPNWNVYLRRNEMVTINPGQGYTPPSVQNYDLAFENLTDSTFSIELDEQSDPAFDTETSYYVLIWHQTCPSMQASVQATATKEVPPDDAGVAPSDSGSPDATQPLQDGGIDAGDPSTDLAADEFEPGGGCACRTSGSAVGRSVVGGLLAALAGLLMACRRKL